MDPRMNLIHSEASAQGQREEAVRWHGPIRRLGLGAPVTVRSAAAADEPQLRLLAELDEQPLPVRPVLIAEVGSRPLAALSLATDCVVADPFMPTSELIDLLRLRARQLQGGRIARLRHRLAR